MLMDLPGDQIVMRNSPSTTMIGAGEEERIECGTELLVVPIISIDCNDRDPSSSD